MRSIKMIAKPREAKETAIPKQTIHKNNNKFYTNIYLYSQNVILSIFLPVFEFFQDNLHQNEILKSYI